MLEFFAAIDPGGARQVTEVMYGIDRKARQTVCRRDTVQNCHGVRRPCRVCMHEISGHRCSGCDKPKDVGVINSSEFQDPEYTH